MLYFLTYCNSFVIKVKRGFRIKMNRTHWVKTAAGLGAACFITIGMVFSGTDASAMTNAGVLDNYYDAGVSVGAGTSSDSTVLGMAGADNAQVNVTAATQAAISTGAAVSTQAAVSTGAAVGTQAAISTGTAVSTSQAETMQSGTEKTSKEDAMAKKAANKEKAEKKKKALDKKWKNTAVAVSKDDVINKRKSPSGNGKKIAKMENGDAVNIIGNSEDGNWVKVKSGKAKGYVWKKSLVKGGVKVEKLADKYATTYAELKDSVDVLNLRKKKSLSASIVTQLKDDDVCTVIKEGEKWLKVRVNGRKGYVARKYTDTYRKFDTATILDTKKKQAASEDAAEETLSFSKSDEKLGNQIVNYALKFVGNPYVWGGTSLTKGADCSGFVMSVYQKFGYSLPHSSASQANCGKKVDIKDLQPGDLVFYRHGSRIGHVVMYIGDGKAVEAMGKKWGIVKSNLNYSRAYCARRIIR